MTKLYRIEDTFRYEGDWYECDVHSYGTLEVCTVPGAPEECDVDLERVEFENCIRWDEEFEDWRRIEVCDLPDDIATVIEGIALDRLRGGNYEEVLNYEEEDGFMVQREDFDFGECAGTYAYEFDDDEENLELVAFDCDIYGICDEDENDGDELTDDEVKSFEAYMKERLQEVAEDFDFSECVEEEENESD